MSAVQERVLGLLPELAAPSARGAPKAEVENADVTARGKRQIATDLLVKAKTGTGKTVAFLVPALEARHRDLREEARRFAEENPSADLHTRSRHLKQYEVDTVGAVILSPTRELATQIATEATRLLHHQKGWGVQLFIGGASKGRQFGEFYRGRRDILVATPGRLIDMLDDPRVFKAVSDAKMLIFDEADTLLDMGFKDQIKEIVDTLPPKDKRQTFMFSATVSKEVQQIAKASLKSDHTFIDCVPANETNSHLHIPQYQTILSQPSQQIPHIFNLLAQDALLHPQGGKAIIFLPTTKLTEMFALVVKAMRSSLPWGIRNTTVLEMHAQKTQAARDRCSEDFRNAKGPGYTILVTTDVSARGVDYPGVTRVIQVGIPPSKDNYVHRVGRTGRAGKEGRGDIVLQSWEASYVPYQLQKMPLKTISPDDVQAEVEALAAEVDAHLPKAIPPPRSEYGRQNRHDRRSAYGSRYEPPAVMETPILPRIQNFPTKLTEMILPEFSEEHVSEAFGSMLGFYAGHSSELRASKSDILEGLRSWSVEAGGLPRPPTTSPEFLSKIGINIKSRSFTARAGFGITRKDRNFGMNDRRDGYQALRNSGGRGGFDRDSRRGGFDRGSRDGGYGRSDFGGGKPSFRNSDNDRRPSFGSGRRSERLPF